jgi:hypothetical protein
VRSRFRGQLSGHERALGRLAETQGQIKPIRHQIADGVSHDQLDDKIRVASQESREMP